MPGRWFVRSSLFVCLLCCGSSVATAGFLVQYETFGEPGNQAFTAPSFSAAGTTGTNLSRGAGLTAVLGANSMNSSAWTGPNANDFYVFGFDVNPGLAAYVDELRFATRSSDRGPGFVNVLYSVDGGAETLITTLTQSGTAFSNNLLNFATPLTVTSSLRILLRSANNTSANGDTVLGAGTLRIGDYSPDAGDTFEPISVSGTVVPEPSSLVLSAAALLAVVLMRWRPRQIAA